MPPRTRASMLASRSAEVAPKRDERFVLRQIRIDYVAMSLLGQRAEGRGRLPIVIPLGSGLYHS
jgi:hypothetical protein